MADLADIYNGFHLQQQDLRALSNKQNINVARTKQIIEEIESTGAEDLRALQYYCDIVADRENIPAFVPNYVQLPTENRLILEGRIHKLKDTPEYTELSKLSGFSTVEKLIQNEQQLFIVHDKTRRENIKLDLFLKENFEAINTHETELGHNDNNYLDTPLPNNVMVIASSPQDTLTAGNPSGKCSSWFTDNLKSAVSVSNNAAELTANMKKTYFIAHSGQINRVVSSHNKGEHFQKFLEKADNNSPYVKRILITVAGDDHENPSLKDERTNLANEEMQAILTDQKTGFNFHKIITLKSESIEADLHARLNLPVSQKSRLDAIKAKLGSVTEAIIKLRSSSVEEDQTKKSRLWGLLEEEKKITTLLLKDESPHKKPGRTGRENYFDALKEAEQYKQSFMDSLPKTTSPEERAKYQFEMVIVYTAHGIASNPGHIADLSPRQIATQGFKDFSLALNRNEPPLTEAEREKALGDLKDIKVLEIFHSCHSGAAVH